MQFLCFLFRCNFPARKGENCLSYIISIGYSCGAIPYNPCIALECNRAIGIMHKQGHFRPARNRSRRNIRNILDVYCSVVLIGKSKPLIAEDGWIFHRARRPLLPSFLQQLLALSVIKAIASAPQLFSSSSCGFITEDDSQLSTLLHRLSYICHLHVYVTLASTPFSCLKQESKTQLWVVLQAILSRSLSRWEERKEERFRCGLFDVATCSTYSATLP